MINKSFERAWNLIITGDPSLWGIIGRTIKMSLLSSLIAFAIGSLIGILLALNEFPGKRILVRIFKTFMGLPPVLAGLVVFILLSGTGPFGQYRLLFTMTAMVIAQVMLITPIMVGMTESAVSAIGPKLLETSKGLRLNKFKVFGLTFVECRYQLVSTYLMGFSRAIAEVGAVSLAGGSIAEKTEVMTTAIMDYTNMGVFGYAFAIGLILLLLSLIVNGIVTFVGEQYGGNSFFKKVLRDKGRIKHR